MAAQFSESGDIEEDGVLFWNLGERFEVESILARARSLGNYHLISAGRALPILASQLEPCCQSRTLICHDPSGTASGVNSDILCKNSDCVVCVSEAQKQLFIEAGADPKKIVVINNGADLNVFSAGDPESRNYRKLLFVGALVQDKGIDILVNSFAQLKSKFPDLTLDVYGSGKMWSRPDLFNTKEIEEQLAGIKFHGARPQAEIAQAYRDSGICVIPSIWFDSFPLTAVEAQVSGCPVVAFNVGGISETIQPGETGEIIPDVSQQKLTETLEALLNDPQKLQRMSAAALKKARTRYDWGKVAHEISKKCEASRCNNSGPVAIVSTWNQRCGLATYAKFMTADYPESSFIVLSEANAQLTCSDEDFVIRCWQRLNSDTQAFKNAIVSHGIRLVHFNIHAPGMFSSQFLKEMASWLRSQGIRTLVTLHSSFTNSAAWQELVAGWDRIIVHSEQNRLQVIACGVSPEAVIVIPHGVAQRPQFLAQEELRKQLDLSINGKLVSCFGFIQPHKGIEDVIVSVAELKQVGIDTHALFIGQINKSDPGAEKYLEELKSLAMRLNVTEQILWKTEFVSDELRDKYLHASDLVIMNYRSQHFESSGACALALGAGALVVTSLAPPFWPFKDAVWHLTSGYGLTSSIAALLSNLELRNEILEHAKDYCSKNSWEVITPKILRTYAELGSQLEANTLKLQNQNSSGNTMGELDRTKTKIRVLMQNRPNALSQPGGDTVLMNHTKAALEKRGVDVTLDLEGGQDPRNFDIVHLFNFALPEYTKALAERAWKYGVPFVVSTLCEDISIFHSQSRTWAEFLVGYVFGGQNADWYTQNLPDLGAVPVANSFDNHWTAERAAMLFSNGSVESQTLRRLYPQCGEIREIKLGYQVGTQAQEANPDLFIQKYGIKDFVFCVGRLESRKNQLGLLKAMEDSELPLVIAGGGFSYQPDYEKAVRQFKRRGKTIIVDRLSDQLLASAYAAARVHALPSWYELPGLVSLEAAYHGCNVVVTRNGTALDYFGDKAFYCDPNNEASILEAVNRAFNSPKKIGLQEVVMANTWDSVGENTLQAYNKVLGRSQEEQEMKPLEKEVALSIGGAFDFDSSLTEFQETLERGELAAKERRYDEALALLAKAERVNPNSRRVLRAIGATYIAQNDVNNALLYFERALAISEEDAKSLIGRGMCEMMNKRPEQAYSYLVRALKINPSELVALHQLIECSFALDKFEELKGILEQYTQQNPDNQDMQFCLAGCDYKLGLVDDARRGIAAILAKQPNHRGAMELQRQIESDRTNLENEKAKPAHSSVQETAVVSSPKLIIPPIATIPLTQEVQKNDTSSVNGAPASVIQAEQERRNTSGQIGKHANTGSFIPSPSQSGFERQFSEIDELKREKKYDEAAKLAERIATNAMMAPDQRSKARVYQAEITALTGDLGKAHTLYSEILVECPDNARAMAGLGVLAVTQGDWSTANAKFTSALSLDQNCEAALGGMAMCAVNNQQFDDAWNYYQKAFKINPESTRLVYGLIDVAYKTNRLKELELVLQTYLERHPIDFNFLYALAGCYYAQNKMVEACEELDKILVFDANHQNALELKNIIVGKRDAVGSPA